VCRMCDGRVCFGWYGEAGRARGIAECIVPEEDVDVVQGITRPCWPSIYIMLAIVIRGGWFNPRGLG
jgi:hypothetical protein